MQRAKKKRIYECCEWSHRELSNRDDWYPPKKARQMDIEVIPSAFRQWNSNIYAIVKPRHRVVTENTLCYGTINARNSPQDPIL